MLKISNYYCKDNWQLKVYKPKTEEINMKDPGWISLKVFISIQQKDKCAMCKKKLLVKEFSLHHIIPRIKGGENNIENLIGLCGKCHDIAELEELNRNEIINYYNKAKTIKKEKAKIKDWHMWVYGGFNRPGIDKKYNINKLIDIIDDITKQSEYDYPKDIILKEKYIDERKKEEEEKIYSYSKNIVLTKKYFKKRKVKIKEKHSYQKEMKQHRKYFRREIKYTKIFNKTAKELSIIFGVTKQTIYNWSKNNLKCEAMNLYLKGDRNEKYSFERFIIKKHIEETN